MALSDKWTLGDYKTLVRYELMDSSARWWSDAEITTYIQDWVNDVQDRWGLTKGTATVVTSSATHTISALATDVWRLERVWFNQKPIMPRVEGDLDVLYKEWRNAGSGTEPQNVFMQGAGTMVLWPPLSTTGTLEIEYTKSLSVGTNTTTVDLPGWVRYSVRPLVGFRAYLRAGPNNNVRKAARYKAQYEKVMRRLGGVWAGFMPQRYIQLQPIPIQTDFDVIYNASVYGGGTVSFNDYTPSGTIDGVNDTFTIPVTPTKMLLFLNGQLQTPTTDYTLTGTTIVFAAGSIPPTGAVLIAWVFIS